MTDDSFPLVPSSETSSSSSSEEKKSSWNFDDLQDEDESDSSNDFFSVLKRNVAKHVYHNEEIKNGNCLSNKTTERSTIRVDTSDLISRCKNFLPILTNANRTLFSKIRSGENVRIELDSDQDNDDNETAIEMNLMFCPNVDTSMDSEEISDESDDDQTKITTLQCIKKDKQVSIIEIQSTSNNNNNNNNKGEKSEEIVNT